MLPRPPSETRYLLILVWSPVSNSAVGHAGRVNDLPVSFVRLTSRILLVMFPSCDAFAIWILSTRPVIESIKRIRDGSLPTWISVCAGWVFHLLTGTNTIHTQTVHRMIHAVRDSLPGVILFSFRLLSGEGVEIYV